MSETLDETKWKELIKEAYSHAVSEKEKILQKIENRIRDIDPVELLSHLSLVTNFIPEDKPECNQELRDEPIIHFLCGLYLKYDVRNNRHPSNQEVQEIVELVKKYLIHFRQDILFQIPKKEEVTEEPDLTRPAFLHRMVRQVNPCTYMFQLDDLVKGIFGKLDTYFLNAVGFTASDALFFGEKIHSRYQKLLRPETQCRSKRSRREKKCLFNLRGMTSLKTQNSG